MTDPEALIQAHRDVDARRDKFSAEDRLKQALKTWHADLDRMQAANDELLEAVQLAYRKHHLGDESIGWDELSDALLNVLCEAMGDEEFQTWIKTAKKG